MTGLLAPLGALIVVMGVLAESLYDFRTRFVYSLAPKCPRWIHNLKWVGFAVFIVGMTATLAKDHSWNLALS